MAAEITYVQLMAELLRLDPELRRTGRATRRVWLDKLGPWAVRADSDAALSEFLDSGGTGECTGANDGTCPKHPGVNIGVGRHEEGEW